MIHRHDPGQPCNDACRASLGDANHPLVTSVNDLARSAISLGNHLLRIPVSPVSDWSERLAYAAREFARLEKEARAYSDDALDLARGLG